MLHKDVVFVLLSLPILTPTSNKTLANFMINVIDALPVPYTSLISTSD